MLNFKKAGSFGASFALTLVGIVSLTESALALHWRETSNGDRGSDPVRAGVRNDESYYVCAALTPNGGYQAGHLGRYQRICYVAWGRDYLARREYLVLQGSDDVMWVDRNVADQYESVTQDLEIEDGSQTLICRADGLPGKVVQGSRDDGLDGLCYTSWENYNISHSDFEVLVYR